MHTPKYRIDLSEEHLVLIVAMLGVALEDSPGGANSPYGGEIQLVMRSLASLLVTMDLPRELREVLDPALNSLHLSVVRDPSRDRSSAQAQSPFGSD